MTKTSKNAAPVIEGTCQVVALDMGESAATYGLPRFVAAAVTTYADAPDYFEVHSISGAEAWLMSTTDRIDAPHRLYKGVAKALGLAPGWRAKAPSGSDWSQAMRANGMVHTA